MPQAFIFAVAKAAGTYALKLGASAAVANFIAATVIALSYATLIVGPALYARSQAKKAARASMNQGRSIMVREPTAPRQIIYGEVRTSGPILFVHTTGVKNETLFLIVGLAGHEVEAIETIFFDDKPLILDGSGNVTSSPYAGKAQVTKYLGTDSQTADAALIAAAPDKWTANHRLRGIAYVLVKLTFDTTAFPTGLPNVSALVRGRKILDTRTGVTAYSSNWALCVRDYLTNATLGLGTDASEIDTTALNAAANISDEDVVTATSITRSCDIVSGNVNIGMTTQLVAQLDGIIEGQRVSGSGIPAGSLVTFVNRAGPSFFFQIDKLPTATGSAVSVIFGAEESRYTINGVITTDAAPGDVLEKLVIAGAGFCSYIGGKWVIHAGAYRTPTVTLDENDLRGPISVQTKVSRREIFNGVKGTFFSPENQWQPADFPPIVNATYTSEDGGERIWQDVELPFTTSSATAQRLAKIALERVRQQITVRLPCKLTAFRLQVGDTVMLTNARLGFVAKDFEVTELVFAAEDQGGAQALAIDLTLRETAAGVWDWNDGEETVIDLAPNTNLPNPRDIPTPTGLTLTSGASTAFIQEDGTVVPRLKAVWDSPPNEFVLSGGFTRVEFKESAEPDFLEWNTVGGDITEEYITDVLIGESYDVRVRHVNRIGAVGPYQTVTGHIVAGDTTGPATPTGLAATAGAGFVSLDWNDNTEPDLSEYQVFRSTTNSFGTANKIAEVAASRFVDASGLTTGTTFYYWLKAVDRSENASAESVVASAVPTAPIDTTPPGTPSAPTFNTESTYLSGDGTVFSQVTVNTPALPSGAALNTILYRVAGSGSFLIADQQTAAGLARIDDLSPGVAYEFAIRAMSNGGALSAVSAVLSRSAPGRLTAPAAPTGVGFDISQIPLKLFGSVAAFGTRIVFDTAGLPEVSHFELKCTITDTDAAVDFFGDFGVAQPVKATSSGVLLYQQGLSIASFVRVRAVSRSGIASAFTRVGKVNEIGNIFLSGGNMASQDANDVTTTGITTGGGGSTPQVLARFPGQASATLTGGTTTEKINIDISGRGFSTKPDTGNVRCFSNFVLEAYYDISDAASTSTNAVVFCYNNDGTNLPAGAQNFLFEFIEYT
jgi:hypothetical protein